MCCLFADEETLATEAETFDCETCAVSRHVDGLDMDNRRAWDLAQGLFVRLIAETDSFGPVLARITSDLDVEQFEDTLRRLTLIYDVLAPLPKRKT